MIHRYFNGVKNEKKETKRGESMEDLAISLLIVSYFHTYEQKRAFFFKLPIVLYSSEPNKIEKRE
jgi:hypothetical protein